MLGLAEDVHHGARLDDFALADIDFIKPVREGDELVAEAVERTRFGRSGIYDVTVRRGTEIVAEFRGRSRTLRA